MRLIYDVSLIQIQNETDISQAKSELLFNKKKTGLIVPGKILEAAIEVDTRRFILFITDDVLYEESLTVVLCNINFGIEEIITIGSEYNSGTFCELKVDNDTASFRFIDNVIWHIAIREKPGFKIPLFGDPKGVTRSHRLKKIMTVTTSPG